MIYGFVIFVPLQMHAWCSSMVGGYEERGEKNCMCSLSFTGEDSRAVYGSGCGCTLDAARLRVVHHSDLLVCVLILCQQLVFEWCVVVLCCVLFLLLIFAYLCKLHIDIQHHPLLSSSVISARLQLSNSLILCKLERTMTLTMAECWSAVPRMGPVQDAELANHLAVKCERARCKADKTVSLESNLSLSRRQATSVAPT